MNADDLIQELAGEIYVGSLSDVREEPDYPDLQNPLHLAVLLIDCDTEISMNGILGFLENMTGRHLVATVQALKIINAPKCANLFESIQGCMRKYGVTWEQLRGYFSDATEYQITSFQKLQGNTLDAFAGKVSEIANGFSLFNSLNSPEDAYSAFCYHLQGRIEQFSQEIAKRKSKQ